MVVILDGKDLGACLGLTVAAKAAKALTGVLELPYYLLSGLDFLC